MVRTLVPELADHQEEVSHADKDEEGRHDDRGLEGTKEENQGDDEPDHQLSSIALSWN